MVGSGNKRSNIWNKWSNSKRFRSWRMSRRRKLWCGSTQLAAGQHQVHAIAVAPLGSRVSGDLFVEKARENIFKPRSGDLLKEGHSLPTSARREVFSYQE